MLSSSQQHTLEQKEDEDLEEIRLEDMKDNEESIEDEEPPKTTSDYKISLVSDTRSQNLKDNQIQSGSPDRKSSKPQLKPSETPAVRGLSQGEIMIKSMKLQQTNNTSAPVPNPNK